MALGFAGMDWAQADRSVPDSSILDRVVLHAGDVWSGRGAGRGGAPVCVRVQRGTAWVTEEGDAADHVLRAGEVYCVHGGGLVVIEAVEDAVLVVRPRGRAA